MSPTTNAIKKEKDFHNPLPKRDKLNTMRDVVIDNVNVDGLANDSSPGAPPKNSDRVNSAKDIPTRKMTVPEITGVNNDFKRPIIPVIDKINTIIALRKIPPLAAASPFALPAAIITESKAADGP
jgi:hypothetical protein